MAATALVEADVALGKEAAAVLAADPVIAPVAINWVHDDEALEWRLHITTRDVARRGARAAYLRVRKLLDKAGLLDRLPLRRVVLVASSAAPDTETKIRTLPIFQGAKQSRSEKPRRSVG